ncbi:MAG: Holliday junction resolvase RuvX [Bacteroidota bacterium]|nr:Holliday junction resolvase RuvX [Bacteroidota bacterium]
MSAGRVLGVDYGSVRIGIAVSDPLRIIALGVGTIPNNSEAANMVAELVQKYDAEIIVVGMPLTLKGEKGMKAEEVENFIEKVASLVTTEIVRWDERFTTRMAQRTLIDMGTTKKQRRMQKGRVDEIASALILQSFLDQTKHSIGC